MNIVIIRNSSNSNSIIKFSYREMWCSSSLYDNRNKFDVVNHYRGLCVPRMHLHATLECLHLCTLCLVTLVFHSKFTFVSRKMRKIHVFSAQTELHMSICRWHFCHMRMYFMRVFCFLRIYYRQISIELAWFFRAGYNKMDQHLDWWFILAWSHVHCVCVFECVSARVCLIFIWYTQIASST